MTPETKLWQSVVLMAVRDALYPDRAKPEDRDASRKADRWIRNGGRDFRMVCDMAGLDPGFIRDAYLSGRIDVEVLRHAEADA